MRQTVVLKKRITVFLKNMLYYIIIFVYIDEVPGWVFVQTDPVRTEQREGRNALWKTVKL